MFGNDLISGAGERRVPMSTCVIYDDRRRARELLGQIFGTVPGMRQVVTVGTADELIHRFTGAPGQVAVVGTQRAVPSGIHAICRVLAARPGAAVVAVGARDDGRTAHAAVAVGARGFVGWDASPAVTRTLIHAITGTGPSPRPADDGPADPAGGLEAWHGIAVDRVVQEQLGLSEREMEVLAGISHGLSVSEIGRDLRLSDNTVKSHIRRLFVKLGVHERAHAVARAYRSGLLSSPWSIHDVRATSSLP